MNKRSIFAAIVGLIMISMLIAPAFAKGPSKAKMGQNGNGKWEYLEEFDVAQKFNPMGIMYVGPDYGAGSTPTTTTDGTVIDIINSSFLMEIVKWFDYYDYTDKDFNLLKFWLTDPVLIIFADGEEIWATEFIFLKMNYVSTWDDLTEEYIWTAEYTLQAYR